MHGSYTNRINSLNALKEQLQNNSLQLGSVGNTSSGNAGASSSGSVGANASTGSASLTAALLARHHQMRAAAALASSVPSTPSLTGFSPATLSAAYLDQALLAADPLLPSAAANCLNSSVVDRLAEENLILKRRLLMRESLDSAIALAADPFPPSGSSSLSSSVASASVAPTSTSSRLLAQARGLSASTASLPLPSSASVAMSRLSLPTASERLSTSSSASAPMQTEETEPAHRDLSKCSAEPTTSSPAAAAAAASQPQKVPELSIPLNSLSFPLKLYRMLEEAEQNGYDHIISFTPDGQSFKVHDRERFVKEVLPVFFKMSQFASFHRQLNCYGFERINRGTEHSAFYHELFRRGEKHLLQKLKRKKQRVPGGEGRTLDDDRAAALKALMGIHRNAHVLLGNDRSF